MHKKVGFLFIALFIVTLLTPFAVDARHRYHGYIGQEKRSNSSNPWKYPPKVVDDSTSTPTTPVAIPASSTNVIPPVVVSVPALGEVMMNAYVTGYSYWDNTPAGTAEISNPVLHKKAGGTGTYSDPITLAVGHSIINGKDILDYPAGTKFYLPYLQKYAIVEDTCGDGNNPQSGPCHTGYKGNVWIDLYVDGQNVSRSVSDNCMNAITGVHPVIKDPGANYPVVAGALSVTGCKLF